MGRKTIIAICGKSASGKDTLADWLCQSLRHDGYRAKVLISDTTRPRRAGETDGKSYHFMTDREFRNGINRERYFEVTRFNGWWYGTRREEIESDTYNVGVFNPEGMIKLSQFQSEYRIIPVYLDCDVITRIYRSWSREGYFKWEYIRRAYADWGDFKALKRSWNVYPNWLCLNGKDIPHLNAQTVMNTIGYNTNYLLGNSR